MTFPDGTTVRYGVEFHYVGTDGELTFRGTRSGTGHGKGTFRTPRTPDDVLLKCAGEGAREVPMDMSLITDTPLVSASRGAEAGPRSEPRAKGEALRLLVRPRSALAGRRTTFAFRVIDAAGRSVRGATVRFAGRRARAGRSGRAKIAATLRRRGRRSARATKRGFRPARATVRVRR